MILYRHKKQSQVSVVKSMKAKRSNSGKIERGGLAIGVVVGVAIATAFYAGRQSTSPHSNSGQSQGEIGTVRHAAPGTALPSFDGPKGAIGASTIADIAQEAGAWVVNIDITNIITYEPQPQIFTNGEEQFLLRQPVQEARQRGVGSGLIIKPDGLILTNNHVVGRANQIKITLSDTIEGKRVFAGKVVGRDELNDLALVKIEAKNLPVARIGSSKNLRPGDWAIAIGSPAGLDHSVTLGIISALGRSLFEISERGQLIQTDAAINPGNSGGPLLNIQGEVIGINTAVSSARGGQQIQNIGFAIPSEVFEDTVQQLLATGQVKRPYVGILMQDLTPEILQALSLPAGTSGVRVAKLTAGSPAAQAGIEEGDIVTSADGKNLSAAEELRATVRSHKVGETTVLKISRGGKDLTIKVAVGELKNRPN